MLWELGEGSRSRLGCYEGHSGSVTAAGFTEEGVPVTGGQDGTLRWWDVVQASYTTSIPASPGLEGVRILAGDGREEGVWAATSDAVVRRWDPRQPKEVHE